MTCHPFFSFALRETIRTFRDPTAASSRNQTLATFLSLRARLAEEASVRKKAEAPRSMNQGLGVGNDWSRTLTSWCGETSFVQYGGNPPPTFGPDMTIDDYVEIPGVDDIMTKVPTHRKCACHRLP